VDNNLKIYKVHFGKAYPLYNGYDKDYHRIRKYNNLQKAEKCVQRADNCKWVEWAHLVIDITSSEKELKYERDKNNGQ
tara:strand:+ start:626 stop:859 length:234 start_codon:yes stop_codon:yes gene_type:complete